jgi:hypothetical protein
LSQTPKRPGTRDISELKARLGLKKAAPEAGKAPAKPSGGVAPPPGLNVPGPTRATQAQPVIPAASDDPFGNMNAMAQIGTAQRAPEIVIVNDGKPVESVSTGTRAATFGKWAAIALVPLILGWQIGAIGRSAAIYNDGITYAGKILGNVARAKKDLSDLQNELTDALKKSGGKADASVTKILQTAMQKPTFKLSTSERPDAVKEPEDAPAVYRIPQGSLEPALSGRVVSFYAHVNELTQLLDEHVKAARVDDMALATAAQNADNAQVEIGGQKIVKYAIVLSNPSDADRAAGKANGGYGAQLVEIGPQMCADKSLAKDGQCPDGPPGIGYRTAPSGEHESLWNRAEVAKAQAGQPFPLNQLVLLAPTGIADTLVKGAAPSASELLYQRRVDKIMELTADLLKEGEDLGNALKVKANPDNKKFTFFL